MVQVLTFTKLLLFINHRIIRPILVLSVLNPVSLLAVFVRTNPLKSHCKVLALGLISFAGISGIWSFLSDVQSIDVYPKNTEGSKKIPSIKDGIICQNINYMDTEKAHCNDMTNYIVNHSSTNTAWQCNSHTDYHHISFILSDDFKPMYNLFISMVVLSALHAYFAIVHDIGLIEFQKQRKKNNASKLPLDFLTRLVISKSIASLYLNTAGNWSETSKIANYLMIICCPLEFVLVVLYATIVFVEFILDALLGPIIRFRCKSCNLKHCIHFVEISSIMVGIARCGIVLCGHVYTLYALLGFSRAIPSPDEDKCQCSCNYIFHRQDFWALLGAAYVITAVNLIFIGTWYEESKDKQWFLYLIKYNVPIWLTGAIRPDHPAGSVLVEDIAKKLGGQMTKDVMLRAVSVNVHRDTSREYRLMADHVHQDDSIWNVWIEHVRNDQKEISFKVRRCLFVATWIISISVMSLGLIGFCTTIYFYNYPQWLTIVFISTFACGICVGCGCCWKSCLE